MDVNINITPNAEDCSSVFTAFVQSGDRISIMDMLKAHGISSGGAVGKPITVCAILHGGGKECIDV